MINFTVRDSKAFPFFAILFFSASLGFSQEGVWTDVFNGKDLTGLKKNKNGNVTVNTAEKFIEVSGGDGYLYTEAEYTHYRARVEWKNIGGGNTGYLYHVDLGKLACNWPSGPELQMMKGSVGQIWTTDCKFNSTGTGSQYNPAGNALTGIGQYGCGGRSNFRGAAITENAGDWNAWEIYVHADSLEIKVNGVVAMRISKLRTTGDIPMIKGHMALQIEGSRVQWRNWQVMDLSASTGILPIRARKIGVRKVTRPGMPDFRFDREGMPMGSFTEVYGASGRRSSIAPIPY